jgi:hypothetical protein
MYFPPRLRNFQRALLWVPQSPWEIPFPRLLSFKQNFPGPRIFIQPFGTKVKGLSPLGLASESVSVSEFAENSAFFDFAKRVSIKVSVSVFLTVNGLFRFLIGFRSRFVSVILSVSVFDSGFFKDSINLFAIFLFIRFY